MSRAGDRPLPTARRGVAGWQRTLVVLAVAAFLFLSLAGSSGVLCFGADGHFHVKHASAQACDSGDSRRDHGPGISASGEESPSGCTDLVLGVDVRNPVSAPSQRLPETAAPTAAIPCTLVHAPQFAALPSPRAFAAPPPPPTALRSVVLRC